MTNINIIGKIFNQQGSLAYVCKDTKEAQALPVILEAIRAKDVQIVVLTSPEIWAEYEPYEHVENLKEFIDRVYMLNRQQVS